MCYSFLKYMPLLCKLHKKQRAKDQAESFRQRNLVMSNSHLVTRAERPHWKG